MARRRYISTEISIDRAVNKLAMEYGDFAALLYTWMIPHAEDNCLLSSDPYEILNKVVPCRRDKTEDDVHEALNGMLELGLIILEDGGKFICFPPESFYKYQTYIPVAKRRISPNNAEEHRETPRNTEERRYPSPSPIPLPKEVEEENARIGEVFKFFHNNISSTPGQFQYDELNQYLDEGLKPELLIEAMKDSVGAKYSKWKLLQTILKECSENKALTLDQYNTRKVEKKEQEENRKSRDKPKSSSTLPEKGGNPFKNRLRGKQNDSG